MTNYIKGRRAEFEARDFLTERGFFVIRSAGSHSAVDLVAISANCVFLIQVKSTKTNIVKSLKKFKKDMDLLEDLQIPECCYVVFMIRLRGGEWMKLWKPFKDKPWKELDQN